MKTRCMKCEVIDDVPHQKITHHLIQNGAPMRFVRI